MYVVTRSYSGQGGSALFDALVEREDDVKALISSVPGFARSQRSATMAVGRP